MKLIILLILLFYTSLSIAETHLVTFSACPPWKKIVNESDITQKMLQACEIDTKIIQNSFQKVFNIPEKNIHQYLNKTASYQGVTQALTQLSKKISQEDTLFIYINAHADIINTLYQGYSIDDESIAWYSKTQPDLSKTASASTGIMPVKKIRDLIDAIPAKQIVTLFDVCHAAGAIDDFKTDISHADSKEKKQAIIFSAEEDQVANFTSDMRSALFTTKLSEALLSGKYTNLTDAFQSARMSTHRQARSNCIEGHSLQELIDESDAYLKMCSQKPISFDPFGLMDDIKLQVSK